MGKEENKSNNIIQTKVEPLNKGHVGDNIITSLILSFVNVLELQGE